MKNLLLKTILTEMSADTSEMEKIFDEIIRLCPVSSYRMVEEDTTFVRGVNATLPKNKLNMFDPTTRDRSSRDSNNISLYYTSKISPSWKKLGIPDRTRSTFFILEDSISAGDYGTGYICMLVGDPMVGHGTRSDNYNNYKVTTRRFFGGGYGISVEELDILLASLSNILVKKLVPEWVNSTDENVILSGLKNIKVAVDKEFSGLDKNAQTEKIDKLMINHFGETCDLRKKIIEYLINNDILDFMELIFGAEESKIVAEPLSTISDCTFEMWASCPYILLDKSLKDSFIKYYNTFI